MKLLLKVMVTKFLKLFLRLAIAISFLSAVADRLGMWPKEMSVWGNWESFISYTSLINPWFPNGLINFLGIFVTILEVILALMLLIGFKTEFAAKISGYTMLLFALAMTFSTGIKGAFDYSVFTASAAAFALSLMTEKHLEVDTIIK